MLAAFRQMKRIIDLTPLTLAYIIHSLLSVPYPILDISDAEHATRALFEIPENTMVEK